MNFEIIREIMQSSSLIGFLPLTPVAIVIFLFQSTLFLALVLIADRLLKNNVANLRKFLWFWALMMIPMLSVLANLTPATRADQYLAVAFDLPYTAMVLDNEMASLASNEPAGIPVPTVEGGRVQFSAVSQTGSRYAVLSSVKNWYWLVLAYGLIGLMLLARIPIGWKQLARLRHTSTDAVGERGARIYKKIADQIGYTGACQVRLTHELESPVSFGIFNPIILFPVSYYEQLSETELHTTLLHELSHIKNRDPLRVLLIKVIESLFFFQPLVWLASRRLHYLSELVADDSVLETGVGADCYANAIVNLIEMGSEPTHRYQLSTGIFSSPKMLVSRVEHLLNDACVHRTELLGRSIFASSFVLVMALAVTVQFSPRSSAVEFIATDGEIAVESELVLVPWENSIPGESAEQFQAFISVDRTEVVSGETVALTFRVDRQAAEQMDMAPLSVDFEVQATHATIQNPVINGVVETWLDLVVTLLPLKEGTLTIPSLIMGNQQTQTIDIEVTAATSQQLAQNDEELFLRIEVDEESVFVNEQFELSIKLFYTINGIRNPQFTELLLPNSVIQLLDPPKQYEEQIDGVRYGVYEKRYVLTPQVSGSLEIPDIRFRGDISTGSGSVARELSAFIEGFTIDVKEV